MSSDKWLLLDRIATLLAAVSIGTQSFSITDRLSNALSPEAVSKGVYEALRIFESMERRGMVEIYGEDDKGIIVSVEEEGGKYKQYKVRGWIPTPIDISKFLEEAEKDPVLARDLAAIAISKIVSSKG